MIFYLISALVVILDQLLKWYMSTILALCVPGYCESIEVLPVFQFTLLHNTGAAFSFLSNAGGWQRPFLIIVSMSVSAFIGVWLYRVKSTERILPIGLCLILGGALGNLVDRILTGYVVDFIVVHWRAYYFPAFNIADSMIFIGACLLILDMLIKPKETTMQVPNRD